VSDTALAEHWADDIVRLRLPMAAFDGVNALIIGKRGRQAIIDTGMPDAETAAAWDLVRDELVADARAVLCTHMHIDHVGQAGKLLRETAATFYMTAPEHEDAVTLSDMDYAVREQGLKDYVGCRGFVADRALLPSDYRVLAPFPPAYTALDDGDELVLGDIGFEVLLGGGHSHAAICLVSHERRLLIAGDQLLAGSGPQVMVQMHRPDHDAMGSYLAFLDRVDQLPEDMVVLPGHGDPITDMRGLVAHIRRGHLARLDRLLQGIDRPMTLAEMVPLVFSGRAQQQMEQRLPDLMAAMANYLAARGFLRRIQSEEMLRFEPVSTSRSGR
jgi:glyoxylase-like metal-dependent hydrolase (beta-lactamase superfamily II)